MTKYQRQINMARQRITKSGTVCDWYKPGAQVGNDPTPESPELEDAQDYPAIPIVLTPLKRLTDGTSVYDVKLEAGDSILFGYIPGDVPFTPENNDSIIIAGKLYHCTYVNTTQPDGTPIIHEVGMK